MIAFLQGINGEMISVAEGEEETTDEEEEPQNKSELDSEI